MVVGSFQRNAIRRRRPANTLASSQCVSGRRGCAAAWRSSVTLEPVPRSRPQYPWPRSKPGMATPIRVLCVDDHRLMREGIARIVGVQPDMTVVAEASDGEAAVEQFVRVRPDVTLMDLEMPTMRGVQAIHAIR